jgi:beta-mannosidase
LGEVTGGADTVTVTLRDGERVVRTERVRPSRFAGGVDWTGLDVRLWWPNGQGEQPLYDVEVVVSAGDLEHDRRSFRVGFRDIAWRTCEGAPAGSDTWLCVVNGRPVFLQGVNFPPMSGLYADVTRDEYRARLELYRDLGVNTLRINACGFLEKRDFYELCDELGLLVWQDLPLTSSLLENVPPDDPASIEALGEIFASFIARRGHHASLFLWCGGNEQFRLESGPAVPVGTEHPMMARLARIAAELDPGRRFIPASPTGPRMSYHEADAGKGLHENVHGPYRAEPPEYWDRQDALFRAELAAPGASDADVIERYAGGHDPLPVSPDSPVWRRPSPWWVEIDAYVAEHGRDPRDLADYVGWSQARQAESLAVAVAACKDRFPRTGGVLLWCGHDSYPTPANCSIVDVENTPKPAALRLQEIWRRDFVG